MISSPSLWEKEKTMSYSSIVRKGLDDVSTEEVVKEVISAEDVFGVVASKAPKKKKVKAVVSQPNLLSQVGFYDEADSFHDDEPSAPPAPVYERPRREDRRPRRDENDSRPRRDENDRRPKTHYIQRNQEEVAKSLAKTKVCRNITDFGNCSRPECSFAHNVDEFTLPNCMFDNSCRYLKESNDNADRVCKFKHSCETTEEYYTRSGQDLPSFARAPRPEVAPLPRLRKPRVAVVASN